MLDKEKLTHKESDSVDDSLVVSKFLIKRKWCEMNNAYIFRML